MYKVSKYCIPVEDDNKIIVFNTLTSSVIKLNQQMYSLIFEKNIFPENDLELQTLVDMGFLVDAQLDENFRLETIRRSYQYSKDGITSAVIAVTTECNARCYYCYENGIARAPMSLKTADAIVDFLDKNCKTRKLVIQWFGGEPLCAVDIIDRISDGLSARNIQFSSVITTNGMGVDTAILKKAKEKWNIKRFQVPLDALGNEYNRIKNYIPEVKSTNPFSVIIEHIHMILDAGFHVNVRTNFNPDNIEPTKKVLKYLATEFNGEKRFFAYPEPITGVGMSSVVDTKFNSPIHPYLELLLEARKLGFLCPTLLQEDNYLEGDEALSGIKLTSRPTGCYATLLNVFAIDSEGYIYKCHRLLGHKDKYSCGDVYNGILYNEVLKGFCDDRPCYDECNECALLPLCHGGCKVKKELYGGHNACIAIKSIVNDVIRVYVKELSK